MLTGIMGAMPEEIDHIHQMMTDVTVHEIGGRQYQVGKINDKNVVLVFSRWGKVASAATATILINRFNIDRLIFVGVAGATNASLNIGDVVIANTLFQHDMDARPLLPQFEIPLTMMTFFPADSDLINQAKAATDDLFLSLNTNIARDVLHEFNISSPKCMIGLIGTGDKFIADKDQTDKILAANPKTLAVEMEGCAVAQVCHDFKLPFVVIRTISDKANHTSAMDFPKFIDTIAREYTGHIILRMFAD